MKINPNATPVTLGTPSLATVQDVAASADAPCVPHTPAEDAGRLQTARDQLRDMPEVDAPFVSAMQDALKAGQLRVDTAQLAQAMMDFYRK
ncbi:flagellar biosynthesis anti-sigma factor FlgM [Pantoea sp. Mb-10]|uniref:flagellar biosynthesis anti-sigma factor FlgM n=1 Tax=unclassified Pantoea TaxID=2630326 RepID=UPI001E507EB8|nr:MULTISPECIES: flagellar biosynthesis anti-sigma factor FlgM [unclassified Pantoea]MCE0489873.1 flagellar biosynthesis anti-sigma factor FlgM [Pantoea sp. Mb-10]MCE0501021.1 flagellar biosynthesis anti-sigma factor FlgM [Pantoea sp. Pb-8]